MKWSLGDSNNDYITYVKGKSNIVQIFDVKTSAIYKEKKYSNLGSIKGICSLGRDIFALK